MLDYYLKMVSQFIDDMRKQKLRCLLTMSGITWGTMAVILLLAFGEAFRENAVHSMSGMGSNIVILGSGRTSKAYEGIPPGRRIHMRPETVDLMESHIPAIDEISPEVDRWITLNIGKNRQHNTCVGVPPVYGSLRNIKPQKGGRFIDSFDMENRRRVIFLGNRVREKILRLRYGSNRPENLPQRRTVYHNRDYGRKDSEFIVHDTGPESRIHTLHNMHGHLRAGTC